MSELENIGRLNKKNINMHEFLCNIIDNAIWRTNSNHGNFSLNLDASNYAICADEFHLNNMIVNLVDNAIKYSNSNPEVTIETRSDKKYFYLKIIDNGIGIDKKYRKKIFKKFFRIPTGNIHNVKGFGLGLSYVKNIIKQHRWKMNFNSSPTKGTKFLIKMPLRNIDCE